MKTTGKKKALFVAGILMTGAFLWFGISFTLKASAYRKAEELLREGDTENAYRMLQKTGRFKDSENIVSKMIKNDPALPYRMLSRGDSVTFGSYEQDNDFSDGQEPVAWIVLDRIDDEILLISEECLDCRPYNDVPFLPVTWATSGVREWLNGDFYYTAFTEDERQLIMLTDNLNPDHSVLGTEGGPDTEDHVYLPGEKEVGIYMGDEISREYLGKAAATDYAKSRGAHTDADGMTEWWLRSPGNDEYAAQFVEASGMLYTAGAYVDIRYGIRPVIWIDAASGS